MRRFRWPNVPALALAALLAAVGTVHPSAAQDPAGAEAFERQCADCHGLLRVLTLTARVPSADRPAWLETFLADHHAPDADQRAVIVKFLLEAAGVAMEGDTAAVFGAEQFGRLCSTCHDPDDVAGAVAAKLQPDVRVETLDRFLADHHAPDPLWRVQVIAYLLSLAEG